MKKGKSSKALITGIAGFAGSHLAEYLLNQTDLKVYGFIRRREENIAHIRDELVLFRCDLRNYESVARALSEVKPDLIFHLAAQPSVSASWSDPWSTLENNICSQLNILQAVVNLGLKARILVVGSNEEYGLVGEDELPIKEANPLRPTSPYAVSKVAQDMLGLQYHLSHGLQTIRVRPFNHIGPRQSEKFVAPAFAKQIAEIEAGIRPPIVKVGNLEARRDFTDVRDIVRAYYLVLTEGKPGEVYNIGSGVPRSIRELLNTLLSFSEVEIEVEQDPSLLRPLDVPVSYCDYSKLRECTGWEPTIPFEESLKDVLNYWRMRVKSQKSSH
jgi:GDP-4-dehydro-6-deoxy-D-mannose reductase